MERSQVTGSFHAAVVAALAAAALLTLAACGGSESGTSVSTSSSAARSEVAALPSPSWSPTMSPPPIPVVKPGDKLPPFARLAELFEYDRSEPLGLISGVTYPKYGVTVQQITFMHDGDYVGGLLVTPPSQGPFPVVVYAPGSNTTSTIWLKDAGKLAKKGYAGLLLDESGGPFWEFKGISDGRAYMNYVKDARRALDLLETMPDIDASRIGFVAWSNGSRLGSFLSGVDRRIKAFVLVGLNNEDVTTWSADEQADLKAGGVSLEGYAAEMSIFDPSLYFSRNKDARFLFVWGDMELTPVVKQWYLDSRPRHSTMQLFNGGHDYRGASKYLGVWIEKNLEQAPALLTAARAARPPSSRRRRARCRRRRCRCRA